MSGNRQFPILYNGQAAPFSIYNSYTETDRPLRVGTRGFLEDGRVFYWTRNATTAALTMNNLIVSPVVTANHIEQTVTAAANFTAGSQDVTLTVAGTAIALREYEEGYVSISVSTGAGLTYQIRKHAGNAGSTTSTAKLYTPVITSTGAASKMSLVRNPYSNPILSVAASSQDASVPVGVPQVTLAAATSAATATAEAVGTTYGWLQTWGPCTVLCDEAIAVVGQMLTIGTGTNGAVEEDDTATTVSQEQIVGYNLTPFVDTQFSTVDLRIRS